MGRKLPLITDVKMIELPHYFEDNGDLVVVEGMINFPFPISRVFIVRAEDGAVRGEHAHKECNQFLICVNEHISVECDDGIQKKVFVLDKPNIGLLLPNSIWSKQIYHGNEATITVICDQPYKEQDYIRDFSNFLAFRQRY